MCGPSASFRLRRWWVGRRVRVEFRSLGQMSGDRVLVDVCAAGLKVFCVADEVVGEAPLPDRTFEVEPMGETALDQVHDCGDCLVIRR